MRCRGHRVDAQPIAQACCGLAGEIDFRVLHQRIESGDETAQLAYDVYIHRLRKYIGARIWRLARNRRRHHLHRGGGENDAAVRRDAPSGMAALGIELDEHLNASPAKGGPPDLGDDNSADDRASESPRTRSSRSRGPASQVVDG